jgi:GNAT superfamily N-acetyltransferase
LRPAGAGDAPAIARLHAESWRRHYRGAYADAFLDGDVLADRLAVWHQRLSTPDPQRVTVVAENDGAVIGFAHAVVDEDPAWGALLDNVHVAHDHKRLGIGTLLMAASARVAVERARLPRLYLWVLEANVAAQAFYRARGGTPVERRPVPPPGGVPGRLTGDPLAIRYVWPEPTVLVAQAEGISGGMGRAERVGGRADEIRGGAPS